jgi:hypothetical protein
MPDTNDAEVRGILIPRRVVQRRQDPDTEEEGMLMPWGVTLNDQG